MMNPRIVDLATYAEPHVTPRQLAQYWAVDIKTIYRALDKGSLVGLKIGTAVRIATAEARRYGATNGT